MLSLLALLLAAAHGTGDPMTPVRAGKIRCGVPDPERKTCVTMARYTPRSDGGYDVTLDALTTTDGMTMHYQVPLTVRDGGLCVTLNAGDIARASFSKAGALLAGPSLAAVRKRERDFMAPLLGHQVCSRDLGRDGIFIAQGYVDGERVPDLDKPVQWIDAKAGYALGPLPGEAI